MRQNTIVLLAASALCACIFIGCSAAEDSTGKMEASNVATVRYIHAEVAKGNIAAFDEVLADNYVRHCQAMPPEFQEMTDPEQLKQFVADFISGVSDFAETFDVIVADSDKVAYVTTMRATHSGTMNGVPPTGKSFECVNIIVQRFENGKIAETWVTWDNLAMLAQLGLFPPPNPDEG
jgi:steroid delta-isomerase-like uncharacterized protein